MRALAPKLVMLVFAATCLSSCARPDPQAALDHAEQTFQHGNLVRAQEEARKGYQDFHAAGYEWAWKFRILEANILFWRGLSDSVLPLLASEPAPPRTGELAVQKDRIEGLANAALHRFPEAELRIGEAEGLCATSESTACAEVVRARGRLEMQRGHFAQAQRLYAKTLTSARARGARFLEAVALLNLSWSAEEQAHFDEALDWADAARRISAAESFADISEAAQGNMGWAYYKLGDPEKAEGMLIDATKSAGMLGDSADQLKWVLDLGYVNLDTRHFTAAEESYWKSLDFAEKLKSREDIINALQALAFVSERTDNLDDAKRYADEALSMARADQNGRDMVYPQLVLGRISARRHDTVTAESNFREVEQSKDTPVFLKWEAERSLANLYEDENQLPSADRTYRTALSTFEAARCDLHPRVDSRLPFLSNAQHIYEDYVHFLVAHGKIDDALRVADYDRGKTLAEGLGRPCKPAFAPEPLRARDVARRAGGTILFYWLGEKQSYLWTITPRTTRLFPLAPSAEIEAAVSSYRKKLEGDPRILKASDDASRLYQMLVQPAHELVSKQALAKNNRVFIIPDGGLNSLNFESLMPEARTPELQHYWIDDVTITSAASLRMLLTSRPSAKNLGGKLLLIGDPTSPLPQGKDNPYPELPNAAIEIDKVEQYFPGERKTVYTRDQATPAAHLNGHPEQFSYIHFVAHGNASRTSPLDSAIILSRDPASKAASGEDDSFKLYARDIIQHPLHAELVTITACYGSGRRLYSGEGLVGLSWAFLRAGAHNVVGALWDVSSASTPTLMDAFYNELQKGRSPSEALRSAKLRLLHAPSKENGDFSSPFYWAPFQLYTGS